MTGCLKRLSVVTAMLTLVATAALANGDEIAERIKPVGNVCVVGNDCGSAVASSASGAATDAEPRSGEQVYNESCALCHGSGAGGAPVVGDAAVWAGRIGQGVEVLYTHAIEGLNGMPAMGMCAPCSEADIKSAVDHMVAGSK